METACIQSHPSHPVASEAGNECFHGQQAKPYPPELAWWHFWGSHQDFERLLYLVSFLLLVKCEPKFELKKNYISPSPM